MPGFGAYGALDPGASGGAQTFPRRACVCCSMLFARARPASGSARRRLPLPAAFLPLSSRCLPLLPACLCEAQRVAAAPGGVGGADCVPVYGAQVPARRPPGQRAGGEQWGRRWWQ